MTHVDFQNQNLHQQPFVITKDVFAALSPLDKIAAKALEKCGQVRIVDEVTDVSIR